MTTTSTDISDHRQVLTRLDGELTSCHAEIMEVESKIRTTAKELDKFPARAAARQSTLQKAQSAYDAAQSALKKQQVLSELSTDTTTFAQAIDAVPELEQAAKVAQDKLQAVAQRAEQERLKDEAKEQELRDAHRALAERLKTLEDRRENLKATKTEVFARLGQLTFDEAIRQIEHLRNRHAERVAELQDAEKDAEQLLTTTIRQWRTRLDEWPELQSRVEMPGGVKPPYSDVHTTFLEANVSMLAAALAVIDKFQPMYPESSYSALIGLNSQEISVHAERNLEVRRKALMDYLKAYRRERGR